MKCEVCGRNVPDDGVTLHRVNPTGQTGIWRCTDHLTQEQREKRDPEVDRILGIIEQDNRNRS